MRIASISLMIFAPVKPAWACGEEVDFHAIEAASFGLALSLPVAITVALAWLYLRSRQPDAGKRS